MNEYFKMGIVLGLTCLAGFYGDRVLNHASTHGRGDGQSTKSAPERWGKSGRSGADGRTISVAGGALAVRSLQAALDLAEPGDVIALEAGATFVGNFVLPRKSGAAWIVIRPASEGVAPAPGTRITPAASQLPKIITPNAEAAIRTAPGAHHYRLVGLEISVAPGVANNHGLVKFGDGSSAQRSLADIPHDLIVDRCYVHGAPQGNLTRGVALNSARSSVIDSYISDCHGAGFDTQAIAGWNGPGPFKIVNNYLEGAGENVMFGGADPSIPNLVPSDIEFRDNYCAKPLAWKRNEPGFTGKAWTVKNLFELKNARRVLITGNLFEHNWVDAQNGFAILFTVRNQDGGAPWSVVEDVTFANNVVRHAAAGINILGRDNLHPSGQVRRIQIKNNLFDDIGGARWGGQGRFLQLTETDSVTVDHNTVWHTGQLVFGYGRPNTNFVFTNNVAAHNEHGVAGDGAGAGLAALEKFFPACLFKKNLLAGGRGAVYPADNFFPPTSERESRPPPAARLQAGTDGQMIGCDLATLRAVTKRVLATE